MATQSEEIPPIIHALAGAVASAVSNTIVYPLDLVTTRLQTQERDAKKSRRESGTALTHEKTYDGILSAVSTIYEEEGIAAMWEGVVPDNISTMTSTFCYHFAYNMIRDRRFAQATKRNGGKRPQVLGMVEELSIGALAGVISRFVTSPASNVVTRSQTQGGTTREICSSIYKEKGIAGFWSGMKASVILAANPSISFYLFELQKALFIPKSRRDAPKAIEIFLMSATGKAFATLLLYPVILIKARTQALRIKIGLWALVKSILEKDGFGGFYAGAFPQVTKGFLSQGIMMLLKDRIGRLIVAGYLTISRTKKQTAIPTFHFADPPKTDVNGLIAATRDRVEEAVDTAVEKIKEVASDVADSTNLQGLADAGRDVSNNLAEGTSAGGSRLVETAKGLVDSARSSAQSALESGKDAAQQVMNSDAIGSIQSTNDSTNGAVGKSLDSAKDAYTAQANKIRDAVSGGQAKLGNAISSGSTSAKTENASNAAGKAVAAAVDVVSSKAADSKTNVGSVISGGKEAVQNIVGSSEKPARAVSNAVEQARTDLKKN